eukprot:2393566-Prymnesium_polylepis.2
MEDWAARLYRPQGHHHLAADGLPSSGLAPMTRFTQRWIHEQMHPPRHQCAHSRIAVMFPHFGGLGAQIH